MTWMKWIASWFGGTAKSLGSLGVGLKAALSGGAPGGWASDHREETAHNTGFNYIAVHAIAAQVAGATVTVFADGDLVILRQTRRKYLAASAGTFTRWKSTYGADDRETDPLPVSHPLVRLLKRPNPYESGANFRYRQAQQVRLTGTCLIWNVPSISGIPCERYVVPTAMASPVAPTQEMPRGGWRISPVASRYTPVVDDGFVDCPSWYRILGQIIDARQVQVIRLPHAWYLDDGQSPLSAGAKWVDAGEAVDEARFHQLKNGIDPSIVWNLPSDVSPDQDEIDRVQAKISAKYGGPENVGRVMVAQSGTSITPLSVTPKDMCYTEGFHDFKAAILALHQTPPVAVGLQEPGAYAAYNASMKAWRHAAVQPLCDMLAESDTEHLAPYFGSGLTVEIESDTVDDSELLEQQLQNDLAARVRTRNEWRSVRGMPPLPGPEGDELVGPESPQANANQNSTTSGSSPEDTDSNQLPTQPPRLRLFKSTSDMIPQGTQASFEELQALKTGSTNEDDASRNESTEHNSVSPDVRKRAELIAEILYGLYGDSALHFLERRSNEKAWDPSRHPRNELGEFIPLGSPEAIAVARQVISHVLHGDISNLFHRYDPRVINSLRILTASQLQSLAREQGITPLPPKRERLIESVIVRLIDEERPFAGRKDEFDITKYSRAKGVEVYVQHEHLLNEFLHRSFHGSEWGDLVGALPGARVYVYPQHGIANRISHVEISVVHRDYIARRAMLDGPNGGRSKTIMNELFEVRPGQQGKGIAARILSNQIEVATKHGFITLKTTAVGIGKKVPKQYQSEGDEDVGGYYVWPLLGYDGPIAPLMKELKNDPDPELNAIAADFKKRFPEVKYISQMMTSQKRRKWWQNYGATLDLQFDLRLNSGSRQTLADYRERKKRKANNNRKTKTIMPFPGLDENQITNTVLSKLDDSFTDQDLPKFSHPEWGENPGWLSEEDEAILEAIWDERGKKEGVPEEDEAAESDNSLE